MNNPIIFVTFFISSIGLFIGSIIDLKTREIPDMLSFGLLALGFGISIIASLFYVDFSYIISSLLGFLFCFLFSLIMFYTGQWGGGDAKMLMALGALIGFSLQDVLSLFSFSYFSSSLLFSSFSVFLTSFPFLVVFLLLVFFVGGLYGLVWLLALLLIHRKTFFPKYAAFLLSSAQKKQQLILWSIAIILVLSSFFFFDLSFFIAFLVCLFLVLFLSYAYPIIKILEEIAFVKEIPVSLVTEGDWLSEDVIVHGETIARKRDLGISSEQLQRLHVLAHEGKIKKVKVKYGIPFVPSFFIAFIVCVWLFFF
ncbi:prepilin peptidase [Candidatus Woesearchaeota archaeon]|nr:prepilin peptidase [Candidatus Woesearchaeota archaeon]